MNAALAPSAPWTQRRWLNTIGLVFLAHVALIFLLNERPRSQAGPASFRSTIHLVVDARSALMLAELPTLSDPALFALPNHHGFSGEGWLRFDPLPYQRIDWSEPPARLSLEAGRLGNSYALFQSTNLSPPLLVADKPLPALIRPAPAISPPPAPGRSEWRIEGELAARPLLAHPDLPSWPHSDILTNTVVQMLVDAEGNPVSATLLAASGSAEADRHALNLARSARFQPVRVSPNVAAPVTWGKLVCQWHTVPPGATNLPTAKP